MVRSKLMTLTGAAITAAVMGVMCGCAGDASRTSAAPADTPVGGGFTPERWPTESEARAWTITRDEALRIGRERVELPSDSHMIYHSSPVVRDGKQFWRIDAGSAIAGGWEAEIDAHTGAVLRSRRFPGR